MISYRAWTADDTVELRRMVGALHESMRPFDENYPPAAVIIDEYFQYLIDEVADTSGAFLLAEEGRPVGFVCVFGLMPPFTPDEDPRPFTFISDLYVEPAYRGRGIGQALLERAEAFGAALGAPRIELAVHAANTPAMDLYLRRGFRHRLAIMTKRLDRE